MMCAYHISGCSDQPMQLIWDSEESLCYVFEQESLSAA